MWTRLRSIVEEQSVAHAADGFGEQFSRFSEAWDGLKWLLCRTPNLKGASYKMQNDEQYWLYTAAGDPFADTPDISVVYTFDPNTVVIYGLRAVPRAADNFE